MSSTDKEYKSPSNKLIAFFEKSRDSWKAKCLEAKYNVKKLRNRARYLAARKKELKDRVRVLEDELFLLRARELERDKEIEALKKNLSFGESSSPTP